MPAKQKPDKNTTTIYNIVAIIAMIAWFYLDAGPNIFYGRYGGLLMGALCAIIASFKNRNPVVWFSFGAWFVLASLIVLLFLPRLHDRLCPYCLEGVAMDARVCPHCQRDINSNIQEPSTIIDSGLETNTNKE